MAALDNPTGMTAVVLVYPENGDMRIVGPFKTAREALDWAPKNALGAWYVVSLEAQEGFSHEG